MVRECGEIEDPYTHEMIKVFAKEGESCDDAMKRVKMKHQYRAV